jgi:hypothetical protein
MLFGNDVAAGDEMGPSAMAGTDRLTNGDASAFRDISVGPTNAVQERIPTEMVRRTRAFRDKPTHFISPARAATTVPLTGGGNVRS